MKNPHEQQAAAMARAGELPDGEQLRECINSGQVSAAQVVAHAEDGEVMVTPYISQAQFDKTFPVAHQEAGELPPFTYEDAEFLTDNPNTSDIVEWVQSYATTALAAERAEVARLREALTQCKWQAEKMRVWGGMGWLYHPPAAGRIHELAEAALTAPGEKHE